MTIKKTFIERLRITGKMEDMSKARNYCWARDFEILSRGPYPKGLGCVDMDRFLIRAERPAKKGARS